MSELKTTPAPTEAAPARNGVPNLRERVRSLRIGDKSAPPPRTRGWLPWVLCGLLLGVSVLLGMRPGGADPQVQEELESLRRRIAKGLTTSTGSSSGGKLAAGEIVLEAKGYIIVPAQVYVSPLVAGKVVDLNITEGSRVKKGDPLAKLESFEYEADYTSAKAMAENAHQRWQELAQGYRSEEIAQAKAELDEAKTQREQLFLQWKRSMNLKSGQALAASEYEQAQASYQGMEHRIERLKLAHKLMQDGPRVEKIKATLAEVVKAESDTNKAKWRLDNCTIRAPISGIILTKKAELGSMVGPSVSNISASLCEMANLLDLEVDVPIPERDIGKVFVNQVCKVRVEAFPKREYDAHVSRLWPVADRAKGAVPVRVQIRNIPAAEEGQFLRPEMGALVTFQNAKYEPKTTSK